MRKKTEMRWGRDLGILTEEQRVAWDSCYQQNRESGMTIADSKSMAWDDVEYSEKSRAELLEG